MHIFKGMQIPPHVMIHALVSVLLLIEMKVISVSQRMDLQFLHCTVQIATFMKVELFALS